MLIFTNWEKTFFPNHMKGSVAFLLSLMLIFNVKGQEMNKRTGLIKGSTYNTERSNKKKFGSFAGDGSGGGVGSTRWGFGIKGGINMTQASPDDQFSVFSYTIQPENTLAEKEYYNSSENKGFQVTFIAKYTLFNNLSISLQPTFASYKYGYENNYAWLDFENNNNSLFLFYKHEQTLNYIEAPLLLRYDILNTPIRPFVHGGGYYGRLLSALKKVDVSGQDNASGATEEFNGATSTLGVDDQYTKSQYGIIAGGGISLSVGPANFELGVDYKIGLNNIIDESNRFKDNTLISGSYDILDNMKLKNLSISMGVVFGI
ncbi:porin family protein [Fulvivirgaceae bacterium BMA12]|uniref:Porin family protein n=1 Tax=Agaribacillus aureus TaxID=3051825 RepID=A0ABT8LHA8_9BACT|nr:porin family protein [Fulvivirgaceae bacterium BMA12]